jgi:ubiquinone/menaquinone biosynthesis C-methylase UbiE
VQADLAAHDDGDEATALVRAYYERVAHEYDSWMVGFDRVMLGRGRGRLCSRARGATLEVAVGTGANLVHYPPDAQLTAVDLSPAMLAMAQCRAEVLERDVELRIGDAQQLDFDDDRFDTVVATLLLSTVPDAGRAVAEMRRVLRPGGRLLVLDFARSPHLPVRLVERALRPLTARSRFSLLREPLEHISAAGFAVEHLDRFRCGVIEEVVARKPTTR